MAMDLNRAQLIGNITQNPELRQTNTGQNVVSFSIATNRTYVDGNGQKVSQAEFHNLVAWGKLAEIIAQYCTKGQKVFVEGRMQTRSWDDPEGKKHYKMEIVADNLIMLGGKGGSGGGSESPFSDDMMNSVTEINDMPSPKATKGKSSADEEISIEDVPF
ncbi:MAG: single-stranded DNA-binding protein [Candidatus Gracilibacteria bacterium]